MAGNWLEIVPHVEHLDRLLLNRIFALNEKPLQMVSHGIRSSAGLCRTTVRTGEGCEHRHVAVLHLHLHN